MMEYSDLSRLDKILAKVPIRLKRITVKDVQAKLSGKEWHDYQTVMTDLHFEAMREHGAGLQLDLTDDDINKDGYVKYSLSLMQMANRVTHGDKFLKDRWEGSDVYPEIEFI